MLVNALRKRMLAQANARCVLAARTFSSDAENKEKPAAETFTKEEIEHGRQEWGLKYDDECLKFQKEWKEVADKIEAEQMVYLESELSELQKKKVDMLADRLLDMNMFEMRYLHASIRQRMLRTSGLDPMKINLDWPSLKQDANGTWPPANPNWFKQQELMSQLGPFMGQMGGGGGGAPAAQAADGAAEKKEEEKAPEEKTHFDIELVKFDPAAKIKVIKEVRAMLGLGLKEAKEMVEGAPKWLKKEVAKEEAEQLKESLEKLGAEIRLA